VLIGLIPQHVERMQPPRALVVPFELGRPLGEPSDADFQRDVLRAAFDLLAAPAGPAVGVFEKDAPSSAPVEGWSCPVNFAAPVADATGLAQLLTEVELLHPWFDRAYARRGQTMTGTSGMEADAICRLLWSLVQQDTPEIEPSLLADADLRFGDRAKLAVEDLKAFYAEAATEQPKPGSAAQIQHWFWEETSAGQLIFDLRKALWEHEDSILQAHARFTLIPAARARAWDLANDG